MFPGFGTLVNFFLILVGSYLGLKGSSFLSPKIQKGVVHSIGLFTLLLGVRLIVENRVETLKVFFLLLMGGIIGYLIDIEGRLERIGKGGSFTEAFVSSSLLFTVGPMTLMGCILEGTKGDSSLILSKATMDGISSAILASSLGKGVMASAFFVLLFQGSITLGAYFWGEFLSEQAMANSFGVGGAMMVLIALKLWGLAKEVKTANLLPALILSLFF